MSILELHKLPNLEKLKIIEALWEDLLMQKEDIPSPSWHEEELLKTEADYRAGRIAPVDWSEAKTTLRARFE